LASDLASFNNMETDEVLEKLRAGLTGEAEPLKTLGININDATIKTKAMELGLYEGTGALDASAKAQAVYALMLEQTSLAQGDFARTSDGLANSERIMKAELADVSAKLGTQLLPIALKVVTAISGIVEKFSNLSPTGQKVILIIGALVAAIGPILTVIGTLIPVLGTLSAVMAGPVAASIWAVMAPLLPIIAIVLAVIAVIALLYFAWKNNWGGIRDITQNAVDGIVNFWNNKFLPAIKKVSDFIGNILSGAFNTLKSQIMTVYNWIKKLMHSLANIELPSWMTPGSPTPWEIGLRGVSGAMEDLDSRNLPGLSRALVNLNAKMATSGAAAGSSLSSSNASESWQINAPIIIQGNDTLRGTIKSRRWS
jgi:hypothetical protein